MGSQARWTVGLTQRQYRHGLCMLSPHLYLWLNGAFYKYKTSTGRSLPLFCIYDSYPTPTESWANLLTPTGSHSGRNTPYNSLFIELLMEEGHKHDILCRL